MSFLASHTVHPPKYVEMPAIQVFPDSSLHLMFSGHKSHQSLFYEFVLYR